MICGCCDKDFVKTTSHQIWCSLKCKRKAGHKRYYKGEYRQRHILRNRENRALKNEAKLQQRKQQRAKLAALFAKPEKSSGM